MSRSRLRSSLKTFAYVVVVPSIPVLTWWKSAVDGRQKREEQVRTKVRVPNVQTIDDLVIERCRPGDVILFDRRCERCAAGPLEALHCVLSRKMLCHLSRNEQQTSVMMFDSGTFDHCGIVVPGFVKDKKDEYDASNLLLLEATASGIVARPLLTRLEMTQSRTVILLPLSYPGDRRNERDYVSKKMLQEAGELEEDDDEIPKVEQLLKEKLTVFRDLWTKVNMPRQSTIGIFGALGYAMNLHKTSKSFTSPSAWLVVAALDFAGAGLNVNERAAMETRVEDFLRDHRFEEKDTVRLRPGWKFLPAITMRETSRNV